MNFSGIYSFNPYIPLAALVISWMAVVSIYFLWRKAKRRKVQSEYRFKELFASNVIGYMISEASGTIIDANDYYLALLGVKREELLQGISWKQFTPPEYLAVSEKAAADIRTKGTADPFEKEYLLRDGRRIWVLVGATIADHYTVSYILDISARKKAERELEVAKSRLETNVNERTRELLDANRELSRLIRESEVAAEKFKATHQFLDSVIENIPNMIFVKDAQELRFVRLNRAGEKLLGHSRLDLLGKNDYDFFPTAQADFFTSKDRQVLAAGMVIDIPEEPLSTEDGTRLLHTKKIPILDKAGQPLYLLGISEDITEKKAAEAQLLELAQAQAARSAAERTNERLRFLSEASAALNASLDIRSLLNSFGSVIVKQMADWCIIDFYEEDDQSVDRIVAVGAQGHVPQEVKDWWQGKEVDFEAAEGLGFVLRTG